MQQVSERNSVRHAPPSNFHASDTFPRSRDQGLKGVSADIIILEEASRIDNRVLQEVIAPLMLVQHTSLLAISTPVSGSVFSQLVKETNGQHFEVLEITLICDACRLAGKTVCPHNAHEIPPWKRNADRQELVETIMKSDRQMYMRENMGVDLELQGCAFPDQELQALRASLVSFFPGALRNMVFVAVDPNGGASSRFGLLFFCYSIDNALILLDGKAWPVRSYNDMEQSIPASWGRLVAQYPALRHATLVSIVEKNYGGDVMASRISALWSSSGCIDVRHVPDARGRLGITTTRESKERQRVHLLAVLRAGAIKFCGGFDPQAREELVNELARFRYVSNASGTRAVLTGKSSGDGQDDLAMCLLFGSYWSSVAVGKPEALLKGIFR